MLLPSKHLRVEESILGLGASLLPLIGTGRTIESVLDSYAVKCRATRDCVPESPARVLLALDWLFLIGAIEQTADGELSRCD